MIRIYVPQITERLRYIFHYVFDERWGMPYDLTDNKEAFRHDPHPRKIIYAPQNENGTFYLQALPLLFQTDIKKQNLSLTWQQDMPLCFQTDDKTSLLPFDVFAACFYFLSRYEEYLTPDYDAHGRYPAENSFAFQNKLMHLAIVDRWIDSLAAVLKSHFADLTFKQKPFTFIPTYDIDVAYAYQNKGCWLTLAGYAKHLLKVEFQHIKERTAVLSGKQPDPYNNFDYLEALHAKYALHPYYFVLFAARSRFDKNADINNENFISLINKLKENANIGLHASYASSFDKKELLRKEKQSLEKAINTSITASRQHYLRVRLPDTYDNLQANHILHDYSMGYVSLAGFRAGTCHSFLFFDLQKNTSTSLRIHPLLFMENAFTQRNDTHAESLWEYVKPYVDEVKKHKGELITLFHNQSFAQDKQYTPIKTLYETLIHYVLS